MTEASNKTEATSSFLDEVQAEADRKLTLEEQVDKLLSEVDEVVREIVVSMGDSFENHDEEPAAKVAAAVVPGRKEDALRQGDAEHSQDSAVETEAIVPADPMSTVSAVAAAAQPAPVTKDESTGQDAPDPSAPGPAKPARAVSLTDMIGQTRKVPPGPAPRQPDAAQLDSAIAAEAEAIINEDDQPGSTGSDMQTAAEPTEAPKIEHAIAYGDESDVPKNEQQAAHAAARSTSGKPSEGFEGTRVSLVQPQAADGIIIKGEKQTPAEGIVQKSEAPVGTQPGPEPETPATPPAADVNEPVSPTPQSGLFASATGASAQQAVDRARTATRFVISLWKAIPGKKLLADPALSLLAIINKPWHGLDKQLQTALLILTLTTATMGILGLLITLSRIM